MIFSDKRKFGQKQIENLIFLAVLTIIGLFARKYLFPP